MKNIAEKKEKLHASDIRKHKKTIRMSDNEMAVVMKKMEKFNMPFGELGRNLLLDVKVNDRLTSEILIELRKIGTNVNQIAKVMNSKNELSSIDLYRNWKELEEQFKSKFLD